MLTPKYLDKIANELFEKHSLAALIIVIEAGDELDFYHKNVLYGITWIHERICLVKTDTNEVQEFNDATELVINAKIDNQTFIDIWDEIILDHLF